MKYAVAGLALAALLSMGIGYYIRTLMEHEPSGDWANLSLYQGDNFRLGPPDPARPRVVLMGNSIMQGWVTRHPDFFRNPKYELISRGISGQTSPQMLLRFRQDALDLHPRAVVILAGINDIAENTGPYYEQNTLNNIMTMAELAHGRGIRVVLCSVLPAKSFHWRKEVKPVEKIASLNRRIRAYALEQGFPYVDFHPAVATPDHGMRDELARDGLHPNRAGYKAMAPLLLQGIEEALR